MDPETSTVPTVVMTVFAGAVVIFMLAASAFISVMTWKIWKDR